MNSYILTHANSLHIHSLKLAHTFTYTHSNMIPVIYNSPCRRYKQHHTYILTGEYAHTYHEVPHLYTWKYSSVLICTHSEINSQKYTPLSHDQKQAFISHT